jgi:hypothetical protein
MKKQTTMMSYDLELSHWPQHKRKRFLNARFNPLNSLKYSRKPVELQIDTFTNFKTVLQKNRSQKQETTLCYAIYQNI